MRKTKKSREHGVAGTERLCSKKADGWGCSVCSCFLQLAAASAIGAVLLFAAHATISILVDNNHTTHIYFFFKKEP